MAMNRDSQHLWDLEGDLDLLKRNLDTLTGKGPFNPVIAKRKKLTQDLLQIVDKLHTEIPDQNQNQTLKEAIIQNIRDIIPLIKNLKNNATERELKSKILALDSLIENFNKNQDEALQITTLNYGVNLFTILNYLATATKGIMTCFLAWNIGVSKALQHISPIFYPINASFIAVSMFFKFLITSVEFFRTRRAVKEAGVYAEQELADAKALLKTSTAFQFFIFTFQLLAALAFAGALTTPLGWAFVAGATLVGWVNETFLGVKNAQAQMNKYQENTQAYKDAEAEFNKQKNEARWKFINVESAILVACGPIPPIGPLLGLIGLGLLAINPVKLGLTFIYTKFFKEKNAAAVSVPVPLSQPDFAANDLTCGKSTSATLKQALSTNTNSRVTSIEELQKPSKPKSLTQRALSFLCPKKNETAPTTDPQKMRQTRSP